MDLKNTKVQVIFTEDSIPRIVNADLTAKGIEDLEKIQGNFSVRFVKWLMLHCDFKKHIAWEYKGVEYSEEELLEIFKKEIGL